MKRDLKKKMVVMAAGFAFILLCLQACNMAPPTVVQKQAAGGTLPTFTPTPCWTVGNNANGASTAIGLHNTTYWYPVVPNANKTLTHLAMHSTSSVPVTYELGIYYNGASAPSYPGGQTGPVTSGPVTGWLQAPTSFTMYLSSGVTYWLAVHSTNFNYQNTGGAPFAYQSVATSFPALPVNFTGTTTSGAVFSLYGTACP